MHEFLSFIGDHPALTLGIVFIITIGICAGWSDYLDRKHGELR